MRVCSTGEGMMAMLNVTNDQSFFSPSASHLFHAGWRRCWGICMKVWRTKKKRTRTKKSCVDTAENLRDSQDEETLMNLTSGTWDKAALITVFEQTSVQLSNAVWISSNYLQDGCGFFLDVPAFQCHQRHEAQQTFSWNPNLEDFMWSGDTIRETTSESLYPASFSSYMQLPA